MKKLLVFAALVGLAAVSLSADIYIKTKTHSDAASFMGQTTPATDAVTEQWFNDNQFAQVGTGDSMIIDLAKNLAYMINHATKSYVETPLPLDLTKLLPPEAAAMAGMFKMTATVNPTSETKKIGSWNCSGYDVTISIMGMAMNMKVWATTDLPFDAGAFNDKFMPALMKGTMRLDDASVKEFAKIKGLQIASEMNAEIMGAKMRSTTEVLEISKKNPPAGVYAVPAGYTKKANLSLADLQKK
ncbi:MAG: DUF4412 domain-containing protein [Candidatus Aminicenantes bacterium]|nr:DUF4412 domain-containing protein [Candidatus Aminicenantes bacterium]